MSKAQGGSPAPCPACLSRRWLVGELSPLLDCHRGQPERLIELLELGSGELVEALAGSRRSELAASLHEHGGPGPSAALAWESCPHRRCYPRGMRELARAPLLAFQGRSEQVRRILSAPAVAFVGGSSPSAYGVTMARSFGRGLSAAGVSVVGGLDGGLGRFALEGALRSEGALALAVSAHGLEAPRGGGTRVLVQELAERGCLASEQCHRAKGRSWGAIAAERLVVALADAVVLVEARAGTGEMLGARLAGRIGRPLAALPGALTNPMAGGPIQALRAGAQLLAGPANVLEMLHPDASRGRRIDARNLPRELAEVLDLIASGTDTFASLVACLGSVRALLRALGELEAAGLLTRLADGRYQALEPAVQEG